MRNKKKAYYETKSYGKSMSPLINQGDTLFIKSVKKDEISINDILVVFVDKKCMSHRVVWKTKDKIFLKGDNIFYRDEVFHYNQVLGKVMIIEGKYGAIELKRPIVSLLQYYFLIRSVIVLFFPPFLAFFVAKLLCGRSFIIQHLYSAKMSRKKGSHFLKIFPKN